MNPFQRPLAGCSVNLSISESHESSNRGFPSWQVNRITLQIVAALSGQGVSLVFGHDWRENGIMKAIYGLVRQTQLPVPLSSAGAIGEAQPLLRNLLPWPDKPRLPEDEQEKLRSTLRVERAGLPTELQELDLEALNAGPGSRVYAYIRSRGLTFLRHKLTEASNARLCIGGRTSGFAGRYPGVIEEALLAVTESKPLYLSGVLGGAAKQVIQAIKGEEMAEGFCPDTPLVELYHNPPVPETGEATREDRTIDRATVWRGFKEVGLYGLSKRNGLTPEENEELFHTPAVERVIELVLIGLSHGGPYLGERRKA